MDKATLDEVIKTLPDPSKHPHDECYFNTSYVDRLQDKTIYARLRFKKDEEGKNWVYVDNQIKQESA